VSNVVALATSNPQVSNVSTSVGRLRLNELEPTVIDARTLVVVRNGEGEALGKGAEIRLTVGPLKLPPSARSASGFTVQTETAAEARIDKADALSAGALGGGAVRAPADVLDPPPISSLRMTSSLCHRP
jgi:hypothetical protein